MVNVNDIGQFITDNKEFITSILTLVGIFLKFSRDYFVGKKKDRESHHKEQEAIMERKQLKNEIQRNTALTVHVLNETAKSQGKTLDDIIMGVDDKLDSLLERFNDDLKRQDNEQRAGERKH